MYNNMWMLKLFGMYGEVWVYMDFGEFELYDFVFG